MFFKEHEFLVGTSIDGPRDMHDTYRVNKGGRGSFDQVMRGLGHLRTAGMAWNALTTINAANADHGRAVYRFLRDECGARSTPTRNSFETSQTTRGCSSPNPSVTSPASGTRYPNPRGASSGQTAKNCNRSDPKHRRHRYPSPEGSAACLISVNHPGDPPPIGPKLRRSSGMLRFECHRLATGSS